LLSFLVFDFLWCPSVRAFEFFNAQLISPAQSGSSPPFGLKRSNHYLTIFEIHCFHSELSKFVFLYRQDGCQAFQLDNFLLQLFVIINLLIGEVLEAISSGEKS
jgi:hypothetical protein